MEGRYLFDHQKDSGVINYVVIWINIGYLRNGTKLWVICAACVGEPHRIHTSHLKETRDRPLSLLLHDFKEDNVKEGASRETLENHKGVASMLLASLQNIEADT